MQTALLPNYQLLCSAYPNGGTKEIHYHEGITFAVKVNMSDGFAQLVVSRSDSKRLTKGKDVAIFTVSESGYENGQHGSDIRWALRVLQDMARELRVAGSNSK